MHDGIARLAGAAPLDEGPCTAACSPAACRCHALPPTIAAACLRRSSPP